MNIGIVSWPFVAWASASTCPLLPLRMLVVSVLAYIMQLAPLRTRDDEQDFAIRDLLPRPYRWIPWQWVVQSSVDFPQPFSMASLAEVHLATLRRTSCLTLRSTRPEAPALCALFGRDCESLAHPWPQWRRETIAIVLHRAREEAGKGPPLALLTSQRAFACQIRAARPLVSAHALLRSRLSRWVSGDKAAPFPRNLPGRARQMLVRPSRLPVRWAVIRAWLNGVPTRSRDEQAGCFLCGRAGDRVTDVAP